MRAKGKNRRTFLSSEQTVLFWFFFSKENLGQIKTQKDFIDSRNNDVFFLPTLATDLKLKRTGLTDNVICIPYCLLRALDAVKEKKNRLLSINFEVKKDFLHIHDNEMCKWCITCACCIPEVLCCCFCDRPNLDGNLLLTMWNQHAFKKSSTLEIEFTNRKGKGY